MKQIYFLIFCLFIASHCWGQGASTVNPTALVQTAERYKQALTLNSFGQKDLQQMIQGRFYAGEVGTSDMIQIEETPIDSDLSPEFVAALTFSPEGGAKKFPNPEKMKMTYEEKTQIETDTSKLDSTKVGEARENMEKAQGAIAINGLATAFETSTYHSWALGEENGLTSTVRKANNQATTERKMVQSDGPVTFSIADSYNLKLKTISSSNMMTSLNGQEAQGSLSYLTGDGYMGLKDSGGATSVLP